MYASKSYIKNLIKEEIENLKIKQKYMDIPNQIFVFNEGKCSICNFDTLLEHKTKTLFEICDIWGNSVLYEIKLYENIIDTLAKAKDWTVEKIKQAWEKVQNFIFNKELQILQLAMKIGDAIGQGKREAIKKFANILKPLEKISNQIQKFHGNHPLLTKFIATSLIVVVSLAALGVFDGLAEAAVLKKGKPISAEEINFLKGAIAHQAQAVGIDADAKIAAAKAINFIDSFKGAKENINIEQLGDLVQNLSDIGEKLQQTKPESFNKIAEWGEKVRAWYQQIGGSVQAKLFVPKGG